MPVDLFMELIHILTIIYAIMIVYFLMQRGIRTYSRNQCLKFTQGELKEKRKEVETLQAMLRKEGWFSPIDNNEITKFTNENLKIINNIFYIYNDLIIGIYEGLFDERYVKMTIGQEIFKFYKTYGRIIAKNEKIESQFMAIEMMLKKWDNEGYILDPSDYKHRRL